MSCHLFSQRPSDLLEELIGKEIPPWSKMIIDSEGAIWIWNNLYLKQEGQQEELTMKDQVDAKFKMQDEEAKRKILMAGRGYAIE